MEPTLSQGVGYGIILGLGAFFALLMIYVTYLQNKRSTHKTSNADEFTAASRNIPMGLMVVSIVSSWTWSLTLLQSATESYNIGISGSWWYGVGGLLQVSVFSIVAAKVKSNANLVTTFPEMAYFRFGTFGHLTFLFCGLICNVIVSSCILIGGGAVFAAVTGMSIYAAYFLIPLVCAIYVVFGGLRATFISDASHTLVMLVFLLTFAFLIFTKSDKIGSPGKMWELLTEVGHQEPIEGNYHGSYLTFRSHAGGMFSFKSITTGFGLVCVDQTYWNRAMASKSSTTSRAYFLGAICWFIIPVSMGLVLGLAARACSTYSDWVPLTDEEVSAGLAAVSAATYMFGKLGSTLILLMVFLSVISSFSGELIATATLLAYDIFKKYLAPKASTKKVLIASQVSVFIWAIVSSVVATIFNKIGITLGWLFYFLGTATCGMVFPVVLTFTWKKLNATGAIFGAIGGMGLAIMVWLVTCKVYVGEINVTNLSNEWVSFSGNITALVMGGVISIGFSLIKPDNYDFNDTRNRTILNEQPNEIVDEESTSPSDLVKNTNYDKEIKKVAVENIEVVSDDLPSAHSIEFEYLDRQFKKYILYCIILALVIAVIISVPLSASPYIFSKRFYTFIIVLMFIWLFCTFFMCVIYPVWESRVIIWELLTGKRIGDTSED
ncbi:hypothetical protein DASC09_007250 [Saccharomycopsis crataegensis]|uniref:Urea transporter n=1 Tax=Saccharomycopsis crataegensis TaxID=43959 RepID=A0AAV5QEL4_9ASCO|nr:hypothetical protein DASC09_007250 [Saccharomycopsis crataegensis]